MELKPYNRVINLLAKSNSVHMPEYISEFLVRNIFPIIINHFDDYITYKELSQRNNVRKWKLHSKKEYNYKPPSCDCKEPSEIKEILGNHSCKESYVMEVPYTTIHSKFNLKYFNGKHIIYNFTEDEDISDPSIRLAYKYMKAFMNGKIPLFRAPNSADNTIGLAISLVFPFSNNYSHWTQESLPLLEGLEKYVNITGKRPKIIIPKNPPSYVFQSLDLLGFNNFELVELPEDGVTVEKLVLPSIRRCYENKVNNWTRDLSGLMWVRERAINNITSIQTSDYNSNVYISRKDTTTRRIINKRKLVESLKYLNFDEYLLSDMSYKEQVKLFNQAKNIIGAHGAGMINNLYSTDAKVIEFYGNHYLPSTYELSQIINSIDYYPIKGKQKGDDIHVNPEKLRKILGTSN